MPSTKAQTINGAYTQLRISGLTVNPSPANIALGLATLEQMMAEYYNNWDMNINYNFENTPNVNSLTGVDLAYQRMMETNLAVSLIAAFNKEVPEQLMGISKSAFSTAVGVCQKNSLQMIQPPRRMPAGSGNTYRMPFLNRFAIPVPTPPSEPSTNYILQGETQLYYEDFSAYLGSATIVSYAIAVDPLLTLVASANATPRITYTITAPTQPPATYGPWQQVKITITDSLSRVLIRLINFGVATPPTIPPP